MNECIFKFEWSTHSKKDYEYIKPLTRQPLWKYLRICIHKLNLLPPKCKYHAEYCYASNILSNLCCFIFFFNIIFCDSFQNVVDFKIRGIFLLRKHHRRNGKIVKSWNVLQDRIYTYGIWATCIKVTEDITAF